MRLLGTILGTLAVVLAWAVAGFVVLFLAYELLVMSGVHVA